jgi:hypothetical protein
MELWSHHQAAHAADFARDASVARSTGSVATIELEL